jgi:hypothetical protein
MTSILLVPAMTLSYRGNTIRFLEAQLEILGATQGGLLAWIDVGRASVWRTRGYLMRHVARCVTSLLRL